MSGGRMSETREKSGGINAIVILMAIVVVFIGFYVTGYFCLSDFGTFTTTVQGGAITAKGTLRTFPNRWLARAYQPAAAVETMIAREHATTGFSNQDGSIEILRR